MASEPMPVADLKQRWRALDPVSSYIVTAPAGSGKTELLIQRYLRLLALVSEPEAIVAITFTRKAAAEMRGRVLDALRKADSEPKPGKAHEAVTWKLAKDALSRDAHFGWRLLENPARMRIQTIDSFSASLTGQMPRLSGFGAQPGIVEDARELYREAARRTVSSAVLGGDRAGSVERLLMHLDNNFGTLESLLISMLGRRDQWLRFVFDGTLRNRAALEQSLAHVTCDALAALRRSVPEDVATELMEFARFAAANLRADGVDSLLLDCEDLTELPGTECEDLDAWLGLANLVLTQSGSVRRKLTVRNGFPAIGPENKEIKQRCCEFLARFEGHQVLCRNLAGLRLLPPAEFEDEQWAILQALLEILPLAAVELRIVFADRGEVDFCEVALAALAALGTADDPTDLALALDYRIQHLLVDEFQDTSWTQYSLLERVTSEWQPGDGRTLFVVGDPMQSIYRFREADVALFLRAQAHGIGPLPLEPIRLSVNFRSDKPLVDWVNASCGGIFAERGEDITTGSVPFTPSTTMNEFQIPDPSVVVHPVLVRKGESPDALEAGFVRSVIESARRSNPNEKVTVLVRARTHLPAIVKTLKEAGLKFRAIEIDQLGDRWCIQDLVALTRALLHPADRVSWLAVLRAPWCGLTLSDLHSLVSDVPELPVWRVLQDESRLARLGEPAQRSARRIRGVLANSLASRRRLPLRRWVESAWLNLGGPACLENETDLEDALTFFELLEGLEEGGDLLEFERFDQKVNELFARPDSEADDSLQLMTIHKAKGLEFDTVIVPGLGRKTPHDDPRLLMWLVRTTEQREGELLIAPIHATGSEKDGIYRYLCEVEKRKADNETARLLYVAVTRAKKRLVLCGHAVLAEKDGVLEMCEPASNSLLGKLWPAVEAEYRNAFESYTPPPGVTECDEPARAPMMIRSLDADWVCPAAPHAVHWQTEAPVSVPAESAVSFDWASETARHIGTVVHDLLRRIANEGLGRWDLNRISEQRPAIRAALAMCGVFRPELNEAFGQVQDALTTAITDPRGRWILGDHPEHSSEFAISGIVGDQIVSAIIDRTFIDRDGNRWIVDFKTGSHQGGDLNAFLDQELERYRVQLEIYARLVAAIEDRPIRLGLYFPLLKGWREWSPGAQGDAVGAR